METSLQTSNFKASDINNLNKLLSCPIELEFMTEAVIFDPCTHRVNQAAANVLITNDEQQRVCPLCRTSFKRYVIDHQFRQIVEIFQKIPLEKLIELTKENEVERKEINYKKEKSKVVQVFIKTLYSSLKTLPLDVNLETTTVGELKEKIKLGYNIDFDIRLQKIHSLGSLDTLYDDKSTLAKFGVTPESTLIALSMYFNPYYGRKH